MYNIRNVVYLIGIAILSSFIACEDDPSGPDPDDSIEKKNNTWVYQVMEDNYLWYDELPKKNSLDMDEDTEEFFLRLLSDKDGIDRNKKHIYFSSIEKKREKSKVISELDPTYGFEYISYSITNEKYYYARVVYVLPGSPAEEAGLKRDDWVVGINGGDNNLTNPNILEGGDGIRLALAELKMINGKLMIADKDERTLPPARMMENNPFLLEKVYTVGSRKVGYLVYNHFSSQAEGKTDGAYDAQMKQIFANFKSQGVNEFVLDLRFNGGGLVTCAKLLASLLAPSNVLGEKEFAYMEYNKKNSRFNKGLKFDKAAASSNLNLQRLWVLTGQFTASSSEAVINALKPFMEVRLIGDETLGKAVGSNPYGEDKDEYDWIIHPITLRICNADREADYSQVGFVPDVYCYEYDTEPFMRLLPLGDRNEKLLSIALNEIGGNYYRSGTLRSMEKSASAFSVSSSSLDRKKTNGLVVPAPEHF